MNIEVLTLMLLEKGHAVDAVTRGVEAIEIVKQRYALAVVNEAKMYQIIFLDYSMPDIDGPQVARAIRTFFNENWDQGIKEPLIFCITAYTEATFKREAFLAGMDRFL